MFHGQQHASRALMANDVTVEGSQYFGDRVLGDDELVADSRQAETLAFFPLDLVANGPELVLSGEVIEIVAMVEMLPQVIRLRLASRNHTPVRHQQEALQFKLSQRFVGLRVQLRCECAVLVIFTVLYEAHDGLLRRRMELVASSNRSGGGTLTMGASSFRDNASATTFFEPGRCLKRKSTS